jgi:hypothetical protein
MAASPYEIISGPATVYIAAVATAMPGISATPSGGWSSLGYTEGGVTVRKTQSVELLTVDQFTGPIKAIRSEEGLEVEFQLAQCTLDNYLKILNNVTVTTGGSPTAKSGPLHLGFDVARWALLVRGPSPYGAWNLQWEIPVVVQQDEPEISLVKDDKATLQCTFVALEDLTAGSDDVRFGNVRAQSA